MEENLKQLLLKDLCGRLPYGVKCNVWYSPKSPALNEKDKYTDDILETINPQKGNCTLHNAIGYDFGFLPVEHVKPYLRPMSSMTEEEYEYYNACAGYGTYEEVMVDRLNFLHRKHFDYRGLIPKGLALEAKEGMYKTK